MYNALLKLFNSFIVCVRVCMRAVEAYRDHTGFERELLAGTPQSHAYIAMLPAHIVQPRVVHTDFLRLISLFIANNSMLYS